MKSTLQLLLSVFFTALVAAAFAISFAAILYRGELAAFLDQGIAFTLLGAFVIALTGAVTLSFRGSILGPQDVPAILIASGAAGIATQQTLSPDALFATVASLVAVTSVTTGLLAVVLGRFRLAHMTRFFPYPVLAGFLATTGLLLLRGGLELTLGDAGADGLSAFLNPESFVRWGPALAMALFICIATRVLSGTFVMPCSLIAVLLGLYALYAVLGFDMAELRSDALLLGPFQSGGFVQSVDPLLLLRADWPTVLSSAPLILTTAVSALIGMTLNASGLELELKRDLDLNTEARGAGLANILSGLVGGIPGYHVVGETLLAHRLGLQGALAGLSAAGGCALLFLFGGGVLNLLPIAFFASVIAYLGLDLLYSWVWLERNRLKRIDYLIVLAIPLCAVIFGFLPAIALGLLLCSAIFNVEYSRLNIVRTESDLSTRRSRVERPASDLLVLERAKGCAKILELSTFIFFGSSHALRSKVQALLSEEPKLRWLVLDFKNVPGFDVSTQQVLQRIQDDCDAANVALVLSGLTQLHKTALHQMDPEAQVGQTLDACLSEIEDIVISEDARDTALGDRFASDLAAFLQGAQVKAMTKTTIYQQGDVVIAEASQSRDIYVLLSGRLQAIAGEDASNRVVLATFLPGVVVGEMAYYTGAKRSAAIVATETSELVHMDSAQLDALEQSDPKLAAQFHRLIARNLALRLGRSNRQLLALDS